MIEIDRVMFLRGFEDDYTRKIRSLLDIKADAVHLFEAVESRSAFTLMVFTSEKTACFDFDLQLMGNPELVVTIINQSIKKDAHSQHDNSTGG